MVSINDVRETVLAICNKNNYGNITPDDFNLYAKQAQLDIFDGYMSKYNYYMNMQNQHQSGSDFANLAESARESIETFVAGAPLTPDAPSGPFSVFDAPSDWYSMISILYNVGPKFINVTKESVLDMIRLTNSNLTAPTEEYPSYAMGQNGKVSIVPNSIVANVSSIYVRYPINPVWGWVVLSNGEPVQDVALTVDFELPEDEESALVDKILEKAGLSIREQEVYKTAQSNDNQGQ